MYVYKGTGTLFIYCINRAKFLKMYHFVTLFLKVRHFVSFWYCGI